MERRDFLALSAAPLAGHVARTILGPSPSPLTESCPRCHGVRLERIANWLQTGGDIRCLDCACVFFAQKTKQKPAPRRQSAGFILQIRTPVGWQPKSWRDIPDGAFEVQYTYGPHSLGDARAIVKQANKALLKKDNRLWFIVAATDGRLLKGGSA